MPPAVLGRRLAERVSDTNGPVNAAAGSISTNSTALLVTLAQQQQQPRRPGKMLGQAQHTTHQQAAVGLARATIVVAHRARGVFSFTCSHRWPRRGACLASHLATVLATSGYVSPARAFDFGLGIGTTRGTRMATFTCSMHDGAAVGMACHARVATGRIRPLSLARAQHMHTACACSAATSKSVTEMWRARGIPRLVHGKKPGHIRTGTAPDRTPRRVPERALCPGGGWIDQPQQVFCSCGGAGGRR